MSVKILERDGRLALTVLPIEEYDQLLEPLEDVRDAVVLACPCRSLLYSSREKEGDLRSRPRSQPEEHPQRSEVCRGVGGFRDVEFTDAATEAKQLSPQSSGLAPSNANVPPARRLPAGSRL